MATATLTKPAAKRSRKAKALHVVADRSELLAALRLVCKLRPDRILESTEYVRLDVMPSQHPSALRLACSNLDTSVTTRIGARVEGKGLACVHARTLLKIVTAIPKGQDVELEQTRAGLNIVAGPMRWTLPVRGPEDFAAIPEVSGFASNFDGSQFRSLVAKVAPLAAWDDTRPVLTCVAWQFRNGTVRLAAADGYRLGVASMPFVADSGGEMPKGVNIPAHVLQMFVRMAAKAEQVSMQVAISGEHVALSAGVVTVTATPITNTPYPNIDVLIPEEPLGVITVDRDAFASAIDAVRPVALEGAGITRHEMRHGDWIVASRWDDMRGECVVAMESTGGKPSKIALSVVLLTEIVRALPAGPVRIELRTPNDQAVFRPLNGDEVYVLMPMFVDWGDAE